MSRYVDAEYIKAVMLNDRLMQGNAEYELWKQEVDKKVDAMPFIDIVPCGECKWRNAKMMSKSVKCLFSGKDDDFCSYGEREGE